MFIEKPRGKGSYKNLIDPTHNSEVHNLSEKKANESSLHGFGEERMLLSCQGSPH